ncbi:TIGR04283 family arsenosugar biosynthesis glycosyltransferase [Marinobacter sp. 2_MG-2023]|uniref:TIGR04283 family arsenosugar biosynthesis glycosyltransferase n=1 Tax=Marinobacter sp. 2_MG-2023 TaxID=3062679 RepID=UPI0026E3BA1E|nr:TIGR04283 family arsenosugar biosynthesis glycosyltransferase [Marinobacter sp. 2_MG-2023]MDO6443604.1 TIGR04283 family arsenosugar biosynthesis glycosyltransferase [Marinobacter sp. 2_MG-2023]
MSDLFSLSIVMPVWMEAEGIAGILEALQPLRSAGHEVIVVDAGSTDGTARLAGPLADRVVQSRKGRAAQMNAGAAVAEGSVLLFLHADTLLPSNASDCLSEFFHSNKDWGRFDVSLSGQGVMFSVIAWFMNQRSRLTGICTGDQAMFMRREVFEDLHGFDCLPIMEDIEFSRRLRLVSRPFCIHEPVVTDSRRWEQKGVWRTIFLMWRLRWRYWRGDSPEALVHSYRSDIRNAKD